MMVDMVVAVLLGVMVGAVVLNVMKELINGWGILAVELMFMVNAFAGGWLLVTGEVLGALLFGSIAVTVIVITAYWIYKYL